MLISTYCVNRITRVWTSGIEWKRPEPARERLGFRAETPNAVKLRSFPPRLSRGVNSRGNSGPRAGGVDEYHVESRSNENNGEGVNNGAHGKEDHALPVVRHASRRGREILRFRVQEIE